MSEAQPEGLRIRAAPLDDRDELLPLRIDLLREVGNFGEESTSPQLLNANLRCIGAKMRTGEFLRWVAEAESRIFAPEVVWSRARASQRGLASPVELT